MEDMSNSTDPMMVEKGFLLLSPDGHYRIEAGTGEEKKRWVSLISAALAEETQHSDVRKAKYVFEDGTIYDGEWLDRKVRNRTSLAHSPHPISTHNTTHLSLLTN